MNYFSFHTHTDISNSVTTLDSVTKTHQFVAKAKELGMTALAFSEHGVIFSWLDKKLQIENAGMKYVHSVEAYITENRVDENGKRVRDNYHCILIARNYEGFLELNKMVSLSTHRDSTHFYFTPRITFEELINTSDNIIITSACCGGLLRANSTLIEKTLDFFSQNRDRVFLELHAHNTEKQREHNRRLLDYADEYDLRIIAGTDAHCLNEDHEKARELLQVAKGINFKDEEEGWYLDFCSCNTLIERFRSQDTLSERQIVESINNTNVIADMVQEFKVDTSFKYPKIYDDALDRVRVRCYEKLVKIGKHKDPVYIQRIKEELEVFKHQDMLNFLLFDVYTKDLATENGIPYGEARGSASGSLVCYLLGITRADSLQYDLNFARFVNMERVSLGDIDTDFCVENRDKLKDIVIQRAKEDFGLDVTEITTFNTVGLKGSIKIVGKGLYTLGEFEEDKMYTPEFLNSITKNIKEKQLEDEIESGSEEDDFDERIVNEGELTRLRKEYPRLMHFVDILDKPIVSFGSHAGGLLVSDRPLAENMGVSELANGRFVSALNMNDVAYLNYVKLDFLGLDNVTVNTQACKHIGIPELHMGDIKEDDIEVWKDIANNSTAIFQWGSKSAKAYIKKLLTDENINKFKEYFEKMGVEFSLLKIVSMANGAIRPSGASYRDKLTNFEPFDHGDEDLNRHLAGTLGFMIFQEDIMSVLREFCGYTGGESDAVRRAISKKKDMHTIVQDVEKRFIEVQTAKGKSLEHCQRVIKPLIQVIIDAGEYGFSLNHSVAYTWIGYCNGWLRHYYALEFLTARLNIMGGGTKEDKDRKLKEYTDYARSKNIRIMPPNFKYSKKEYFFDRDTNCIYKGLGSVKGVGQKVNLDFFHEFTGDNFLDLIYFAMEHKVKKNVMEALIKVGYFRDMGSVKYCLRLYNTVQDWIGKKTLNKGKYSEQQLNILKNFCDKETEKSYSQFRDKDFIAFLAQNFNKEDEYDLKELLEFEIELLGSVSYANDNELDDKFLVLEVGKWRDIEVHNLNSGIPSIYKVYAKQLTATPLKKGDIITISKVNRKNKMFKDEMGEWCNKPNEYNYYMEYTK